MNPFLVVYHILLYTVWHRITYLSRYWCITYTVVLLPTLARAFFSNSGSCFANDSILSVLLRPSRDNEPISRSVFSRSRVSSVSSMSTSLSFSVFFTTFACLVISSRIFTVAIYANFAHTNESLVLQNSILLTAGKTP